MYSAVLIDYYFFQVTLQKTVSLLRACSMLFCLKRMMKSHNSNSSRPLELNRSKTQTKRRRKRRWTCDVWCHASLLVPFFYSFSLPFCVCLMIVSHLLPPPRLCMTKSDTRQLYGKCRKCSLKKYSLNLCWYNKKQSSDWALWNWNCYLRLTHFCIVIV